MRHPLGAALLGTVSQRPTKIGLVCISHMRASATLLFVCMCAAARASSWQVKTRRAPGAITHALPVRRRPDKLRVACHVNAWLVWRRPTTTGVEAKAAGKCKAEQVGEDGPGRVTPKTEGAQQDDKCASMYDLLHRGRRALTLTAASTSSRRRLTSSAQRLEPGTPDGHPTRLLRRACGARVLRRHRLAATALAADATPLGLAKGKWRGEGWT